jgi:AraC family transcriptional regulator of adaptative response/methylated-DNA-[protein]-cysteine methyltransferase
MPIYRSEIFDKANASETIQYTLGTHQIGQILVAVSQRGVCAIFMGGSAEALAKELRSQFPEATLHRVDDALKAVLGKITDLIQNPAAEVDLLMDIRGNAFQRMVWTTLRETPVGKTVTYQEIASKVGGTAQEVGEACAANMLAVIIPCHRVIRSDGSLAGYRWGTQRKRRLLQREQEVVPEPGSLFHAAALSHLSEQTTPHTFIRARSSER